MSGVLLIFILTVSSSFKDNTEIQAGEYYDVLEWWITAEKSYRIKTFSIDADIQVAEMQTKEINEMIETAEGNTKKNYGDVIVQELKIEIKDMKDDKELNQILKQYKLKGKFENGSILFWNPDGRAYESKTEP
jgi:hypothetical protein